MSRIKRITSIFLIASVILLQFSSYATAETQEDLVVKYINLSGIGDILPTLPEQFDSIYAQRQLVSDNPESEKEIYFIISDSFDLAQAEKDLFSVILENSDIEFLKKITTWQESSIVRNIIDEEKKSSGHEEQANLLHYIADLQLDPPSQRRIELIQDLVNSMQLPEITANMVIEIFRGMISAINLSLPEEKQQAEEDIAQKLAASKSQIKEGARQQQILSSFYTYRNISDEDLLEYIQFYKTATGKKEADIVKKALTSILKNWFVEVGERLAVLANEKSRTCK